MHLLSFETKSWKSQQMHVLPFETKSWKNVCCSCVLAPLYQISSQLIKFPHAPIHMYVIYAMHKYINQFYLLSTVESTDNKMFLLCNIMIHYVSLLVFIQFPPILIKSPVGWAQWSAISHLIVWIQKKCSHCNCIPILYLVSNSSSCYGLQHHICPPNNCNTSS